MIASGEKPFLDTLASDINQDTRDGCPEPPLEDLARAGRDAVRDERQNLQRSGGTVQPWGLWDLGGGISHWL